MAQAMAAAAAHSMPPFPLPALPRVRPPPIPRGTPGPNTLPMPNELPPDARAVWADGKWVLPHYNAAKHRRKVVSRQLEKALQHEVRGMNIYAYKNRITQQVVYSLTKNMDNNKIMKQLLFHGKKTVPSSIRRDLWSPYFSVHFPKTPDGAAKGLEVFRHLRELSLRRQLNPPKYMKIVDEEYLARFKEKAGHHLHQLLNRSRTIRGWRHRAIDIPIPGQPVPNNLLAKRLMYQAGTSVADLSAVLNLMAPDGGGLRAQKVPELKKSRNEKLQTPSDAPHEQLDEMEPADGDLGFTQELTGKEEKQEAVLMSLSDRALKRIHAIRKQEEKKLEQIEARKVHLQQGPGQVRLDRHTLDRLSTEYDGSIGSGAFPTTLGMIEAKNQAENIRIALENAIKNLNEEKASKRKEIESTEAARIDQELAARPAEERQQIESATQAEKERITSLINQEISKTRDLLKQYKEQARVHRAEAPDKQLAAEDRQLVRETTQYLLQKKAYLLQRYATWCGPYAEISTRIEEAMATIVEAHQQRLAELQRQTQSELEDKLQKNAQGVLVLWANPNDGQYAEKWPLSVEHGKLEDKAVVLHKTMTVRQHAYLDANEEPVDEQMALKDLPHSSSVHVFGIENLDEKKSIAKDMEEAREKRVAEYVQTSKVEVRDKIIALQILRDDLTQDLDYFDPDLKRAIKAEVNNTVESLENDLNLLSWSRENPDPEWRVWVEYMLHEDGISVTEADKMRSLQTGLSQITPEGGTIENSGQVIDTTISAQAKDIAMRLADVTAELAICKFNNPHIVDGEVPNYEKFATLFKERKDLGQLYPAAEEWLSRDHSVFKETESAPEGVRQIRDLENQHDFVAGAMQRSRLSLEPMANHTPAQRQAMMTKKIMHLKDKLEKTRTASFRTESARANVADGIRVELNALREERVKLIQTTNPAFDKQAWREYQEQELGIVADRVETQRLAEEEAERARKERATEAQKSGSATLFDRVKGLFSRR